MAEAEKDAERRRTQSGEGRGAEKETDVEQAKRAEQGKAGFSATRFRSGGGNPQPFAWAADPARHEMWPWSVSPASTRKCGGWIPHPATAGSLVDAPRLPREQLPPQILETWQRERRSCPCRRLSWLHGHHRLLLRDEAGDVGLSSGIMMGTSLATEPGGTVTADPCPPCSGGTVSGRGGCGAGPRYRCSRTRAPRSSPYPRAAAIREGRPHSVSMDTRVCQEVGIIADLCPNHVGRHSPLDNRGVAKGFAHEGRPDGSRNGASGGGKRLLPVVVAHIHRARQFRRVSHEPALQLVICSTGLPRGGRSPSHVFRPLPVP
jgi:hypothetical protein